MTIKLPTSKTPVLWQGITGASAAMHAEKALAYGTNIVAGVSRDRSISKFMNIPVFQSVKEAVRKTAPQISVVFSSSNHIYSDVEEAIKAKIPVVICTANHVPYHDALKMKDLAQKYRVTLIGPSAPGILLTDEVLIGTIPANLFPKGDVGIISRSSSLMYEAVQQMSDNGLGISACVAVGSAPIIGTSLIPVMETFLADKKIKQILLVGKVYGDFELELASFLKKKRTKKKIAVYLAGRKTGASDKNNLLGVENKDLSALLKEKEDALKAVGVTLISNVYEIGAQMKKLA